ncbi:MAG: polymer-forming cytoskeletal protein [Verrucomicrobiaceae bacterium]|nr:polymer-forming cytoskeletal protein [Verrucomicrobiaceae bacterium]
MLEPFATLQESGFSQHPGGAASKLDGWSPELIASLDWVRLSELARALAAEAGCELAGSSVLPDGSVHFGMIERPRTTRPQRALVKIVPWNEWGATPETVERFAQEVGTARDTRGILIAPSGFSTAAMHAAQEHRIEAVDAAALHAALLALPEEKSDFLFVVATAGDCSTPTCPICQKKLQKVQQQTLSLPSRTIDVDGLIADPVVCDSLVIAAGCEVTFLHEVRACSIHVHGRAAGDFLCQGPVTLHETGTLSGNVAARSLVVRDGGQLLGQFRILEGRLESLVRQVARWHWRCGGGEGRKACAGVIFEPHNAQ